MKFLKFYKLYDWMIEEMGASADTVLISVMFSFSEMGKECRLSYAQIADILKVSRRNAIARVKRLCEDGYITVKSHDRDTNVYAINRNAFKSPSDASDTTPSDAIDTRVVMKTSLASDASDTTPSDAIDTSPSDENITQIEKKKKSTKKEKESGREPGGESFSSETAEQPKTAAPTPTPSYFLISDFPNIRITKQQYDFLRYRFDYSTVKDGKTLETYFAIVESKIAEGTHYNSQFEKIRAMIMQDGGKLLDEQTAENNKRNYELIDFFSQSQCNTSNAEDASRKVEESERIDAEYIEECKRRKEKAEQEKRKIEETVEAFRKDGIGGITFNPVTGGYEGTGIDDSGELPF